jgi:nucleotide-binding universal stress UspA family protein
MTNRILVPLDGSNLAERALPWARMLARGLSAELVLLRAVTLPAELKDTLGDADVAVEKALVALDADADRYLGQVAGQFEDNGLRVHPVVYRGPAAEVIVDYAQRADIQLIVMATHGYTGHSRWRHGSVAERVLQTASVPVLMVCAHTSDEKTLCSSKTCRTILVPLDGSPVAEQVLPAATSVARALDAELVLFRVAIAYAFGPFAGEWYVPLEGTFETANQIAEVYLKRVANSLTQQGYKASTAVRSGPVADAIIDYAEESRIDLIAMCTHGRTGLGRWVLGNVAERVLRARCTPLMLVRAQRPERIQLPMSDASGDRIAEAA